MLAAGDYPSEMMQKFAVKAHRDQILVTWTLKDVQNRFKRDPQLLAFDAVSLVELLVEQKLTVGALK